MVTRYAIDTTATSLSFFLLLVSHRRRQWQCFSARTRSLCVGKRETVVHPVASIYIAVCIQRTHHKLRCLHLQPLPTAIPAYPLADD